MAQAGPNAGAAAGVAAGLAALYLGSRTFGLFRLETVCLAAGAAVLGTARKGGKDV